MLLKLFENNVPLRPIMQSNCFKNIMTFSLLVFYINRGLFVSPCIEISYSSGNEINSLLEVIINWAGGYNDLDEDGDCPETYNAAQIAQPLIDQNLMRVCLTCPYISAHKIFYLIDEAMPSLDTYGTIDHPPELT